MTETPRPLPPITIMPAGAGRALVRGLGRRTLDALGVDRSWSAEAGGWLLSAADAAEIAAWAASVGRAVEHFQAVQRDG